MPFVCACGQGLLLGVRYPMVGAHWWRGPCSGDDFPEMLPGCRPLSYTEDTVSQETMSWASCSYPLPTLSSSVFLRLECSGCFVRVSIWAGHPMVGCFLCFLQLWVSAIVPMPYKEDIHLMRSEGYTDIKNLLFSVSTWINADQG